MSRFARLSAGARRLAEKRVRNLPAARKLRMELTIGALERFAGDRSLHVLDAGSGEGLLAEELAKRHSDWRIVAVDADEEQLDKGRARARLAGVTNVEFACVDVTGDVGESRYDAVAAIECLEEIPDDDAALASMARALRPGGLLLAHVPERRWKPVLAGSEATWRHEVRHGYGAEELRAKLERAGFTVTAVTPTSRGTVRLAQEMRDRIQSRSLKLKVLAAVPSGAAVHLERRGITWGQARSLFAEAVRV